MYSAYVVSCKYSVDRGRSTMSSVTLEEIQSPEEKDGAEWGILVNGWWNKRIQESYEERNNTEVMQLYSCRNL